jgi:hypothetical protein
MQYIYCFAWYITSQIHFTFTFFVNRWFCNSKLLQSKSNLFILEFGRLCQKNMGNVFKCTPYMK